MTDYTPTTLVVRHAVTFPRERLGEPRPIKPEAFDRWLDQVRADAWEAGRIDSQRNAKNDAYGTRKEITNPYRKEQDS